MSLAASMKAAVSLAVAHGNSKRDVNLGRWAVTYSCDEYEIEREFDRHAEIASLKASEAPDDE